MYNLLLHESEKVRPEVIQVNNKVTTIWHAQIKDLKFKELF